MPLIPCRSIGGLNVKKDDTSRCILIEDDLVLFTKMEYRLLCLLLDNDLVSDETLVQSLFGTSIDKSVLKALEKHIENAKSKLRQTRLYIRRVHKYGYSLVPTEQV